jgi:hypothetical protein
MNHVKHNRMHMIELAGLADFGDLNNIIGLVDKDADALAVEVGGHEEAGGHDAHTHVRPVTKDVFGSGIPGNGTGWFRP